ncbi:MAG TPA: AraC family transcriptional regulator [Ferruginibacter sp.]|nr:AraC family transcriptional regulator [Ferruginibacter sp.]HMP21644.1 AraC family transcriptional regulator [Ferruginibacter sp.]
MRPFIEKLNINEANSFYARTHSTPEFEVGWHQHSESELILFKEGYGTAFVGNYVGEFKKGDIFFIGPDLPHTFQKIHKDLFVSAVVVQFQESFWGNRFLALPECRFFKDIFEISLRGLRITGNTKHLLYEAITSLETLNGFARIIRLSECLHTITERKEYELLSCHELKEANSYCKDRIDNVYQYTVEHYAEPISLEKVAGIAAMTVPAFCAYFKKATRKTYIEFLTDVRVENACKMLVDTDDCINEICYKSGFNTLTNFNRQFQKVKQSTPSQYRKMFKSGTVLI